MNFAELMNPVECVKTLAAAFGGLSQVDMNSVGLALAGRYINVCMTTPICPEVLDRIFKTATEAYIGEYEYTDEQFEDARRLIQQAFESRFEFQLSGDDYITTYFQVGEEGTPEALGWANGTDWRSISGKVPESLASVRGTWDKTWAA